ncbi:hypothetical protein [Nocardia bhagyanarayanae]|uniref:DUF8020 domain-containing protein n=1 Tax=Nocardia bhagyanarayanae TaxID=1215925 RepID=A0A543FF45_9NOCA|nr:hypothetical protein [Nocardia bhagyanarayanae]TQM32477.1 hypothetical protein FB390_4159 [Nocardia bhagyanarayanae]
MKMRNTAVTAALAAAALATAATAHAAPTADDPDAAAVRYEVTRSGDSAVLTISNGTLRQLDQQLVLVDRDERFVAAIPLSYRIDDTAYPITARVDDTTATLTPSKDDPQRVTPVAATDIVTVEQAASQIAESFTPRDAQALGVFAQRAAIGAAVSAVLGAVLGGGVGCLVGAAAGATISSPLIALLVPFVGATIAGCVLGMATLGAVGSMAGIVLAGGPITLFSAIQYFSTILAPCPPELAQCKDPAQQPAPQAK